MKNGRLTLTLIVVVFLAYLFSDLFFGEKLTGGSEVFPWWVMVWDSKITLLINRGLASQPLDIFFSLVTRLGLTYFWLFLAMVLWFRRMRLEAFLLTLTIVLSSLIVLPARIFIPRGRPFTLLDVRTLWLEGGYSFPSGHTKNVFASAKILGNNKNRKIKLFLYLLAFLVGLSRIYLGLHWLTGVLVGALVRMVFKQSNPPL